MNKLDNTQKWLRKISRDLEIVRKNSNKNNARQGKKHCNRKEEHP